MTTTSAEFYTERDAIRAARAAFVRDCLRSERWSTRAAALSLGTNHTSLGSRLRAETSFLAEEIESIAHLLKRDPVEFYAAYLAAGNGNGPSSEEDGPRALPHLDSNQEPAGFQPGDDVENVTHVTFGDPGDRENEVAGELILISFGGIA